MALTLRAAITATQTTFDVDGADTLATGTLRSIGDEVVEIRAAVPQTLAYSETTYQRLTVYRGMLGTTRAAHDAEAALEAYSVSSAPSVVHYSEEDPGAVGAGAIWLQPDINTLSSKMHIRNAEDTAWEGLWISRTDQGEIRLETSDAEDDPIGRVVVAPGALSLLGAAASHANVTLSLATTETSLVMLDSSQTRIVGFVMDAQGFHIGGSTEPALRSGAADPSAGAGVAAPQGSAYLRSNGQLWMKTGAGNTAWTQMATVP